MQQTHEAQATTSASSQPTGLHGQQPKAGSSSVGAWLTQSLAAIKRRGRSTDDGQSLAIPPAKVSAHEQHQVLVDSLIPQAAPAGAKSDTPAAVLVTAQPAEQAVKVKRKPGRPRKIPLKIGAAPPTSTATHPLFTPAAGTSIMQLTSGPQLPYGVVHLPDAQLALSPPATGPHSSAADAVPAGALMPHRRNSSVQIDMSKLLKSRTKAQPPSSQSSGGGSTPPAHRVAPGAIVPEGTSVAPTNGLPNSTVVESAAATAANNVAPAAAATGAEVKTVSEAQEEAALMVNEDAPMTASQGARAAAEVAVAMATLASAAAVATAGASKTVLQADTAAAVVSEAAPMTGSKGGREAAAAAAGKSVTPFDLTGSPAKQTGVSAAHRPQSAASSVTLSASVSPISAPVSPTSPTATSVTERAEAAKLAAAALKAHSTADQTPVHESAQSLPPAATTVAASSAGVSDAALPKIGPVHADPFSAAGQATSRESPGGTAGKAVKQTQQGQEQVLQDRSQSHNLELPLSVLLNGGPVKRRGRPYKNAANAEKAAQRDARKAAQAAVEKAAYQAAGEAAQVVMAAPPVKKRRGRPPKDPAKLAAALAAYQANAHARQAASTNQEQQGNPGFGFDTVMEAAQAAAAHASATVAGPSAAVAGPAQQLSLPQTEATITAPRSGQKKCGRPPKSIAKVLGDNLHSLSGSAADRDGDSAARQETVSATADDVAEDEDDDQALLDAAAVLTSDLPFPQGIRRQALPFQQSKRRQPKGRHRSSSHAKVQSKPAAVQGKQRRRGLELVSSRATALLDTIGPDPNGPAQDQIPSPQPHPGGSTQMQGNPLAGSHLERAAPFISGRPVKKQRKRHHSSQQPATAAAGSTGDSPQATPAHAPSLPSPGLPEAMNDIAHTPDASAAAVPTAAVSSPGGHDAGGLPDPHATPMPSVAAAEGASAAPSLVPDGSPIHMGSGEQTVGKAPQTLLEQIEKQVEQQQQRRNGSHITRQEVGKEAAHVDDHAVGHPTAHMALLQQQCNFWQNTLAKGKFPMLKGKATPPKGKNALSEGRQEPCSPTSSGGIQPPVMPSHLPNPDAASFMESLKKTLDAGRELGQPPLQQNLSSLAHSAQPHSRGSDTALRMATAETSRQAAEPSQQPDLDEPLQADSSSQPAHPLHTAEPLSQAAQQQQPAALQQPVLALLVGGLPPIVLGSFQGDMQRARIILEAAGFLVPLDISSSLLPPGLSQGLPQQQAVHAALYAEHAELNSDQTAAADKDGTSSADVAAGMQHPSDLQMASAQEASLQGASLRGAHRRKQKRGSEQPVRFAKSAQAQQSGADKPKRGRRSNVVRAAAAAATAAAEAHGYSREGEASPSGGPQPTEPPLVPARRSLHPARLMGSAASALPLPPLPPKHLSQDEWRRMGFRGEFQGTGQLQDALQHHDNTTQDSDAGRGMTRGRGSAHMTKPALSAKRTRTDRARADHSGSSLPDSASMDAEQPHVPRRKRSRPLEVLAAANVAARAAAAARAAHEAHVNQNDCTSDPLSSLAAAAAAESASDADLAKSPEQAREATTHMRQSSAAVFSHMEGALRTGSEDAHQHGRSHELDGQSLRAHQASAPVGLLDDPTGHAGGEALVGRPVAKRFGSCPKLFRGRIGYYAPRLCPSAPFHVQYEDGDSEDLTWQEVLDILV